MIDEYWTWKFYGYHSDDLSTQSNRSIVAICEECCQYRVIRNDQYHDLCHICSVSIPTTKIHRDRLSESGKLKTVTDEARQHMSAGQQGIPYEDWTEFAKDNQYCELFDEACRERIRKKYDYRCFVCDKPQHENISKNGNVRKLSVHHADLNKNQGCNGIAWKLIPLCMQCHPIAHTDPTKYRIEYVLADEE